MKSLKDPIITLRWINSPNFKHDIELKIGENTYMIDSYFFWTSEATTDETSLVKENWRHYLSCVRHTIENLGEAEYIFFPIDFSDQYLAGFKVFNRKDDILYVEYGDVIDIKGFLINFSGTRLITNLDDRKFEPDLNFITNKQLFASAFLIK